MSRIGEPPRNGTHVVGLRPALEPRVIRDLLQDRTLRPGFETRLDDSFRERLDPAITVRFSLVPDGDGAPTDLLAWTTTPWTLPSNLASPRINRRPASSSTA